MWSLVTASPVETAAGPPSTRMTVRSRAWLVLGSGTLARTLTWGLIEAGIIAATVYQSLSVASLMFSYDIASVYLRTLGLLAFWLILSLAAFMAFFCEEVRTAVISFLIAQVIAFSLAAGVLGRCLPQGAYWETALGAISPYYFQTSLDAAWFLVETVIVVFVLGLIAVLVGSGVREGSWPMSPLSPGWKILPLGLAIDCLAVFWPISPSSSGNVITDAGTVAALDNWSIPIMAVLVGLAVLVQVLWLKKVPREIRAEHSAIPRIASVMVGGFAVISLSFAASVYSYSIKSASGFVCSPPRNPTSCFAVYSPEYQAAANTFLAILLILGFSLIPLALTLYGTRRFNARSRRRMESDSTSKRPPCFLKLLKGKMAGPAVPAVNLQRNLPF